MSKRQSLQSMLAAAKAAANGSTQALRTEENPFPQYVDEGDLYNALVSVGGSAGIASYSQVLRDLGGHRMLMMGPDGPNYASSKILDHAKRVIGMSLHAVSYGGSVRVCMSGDVTEPTWNWNPSLPVWLGENGTLTQTVPSASTGHTFSLIVGFARTPTTIYLKSSEPVRLAL